MKGLGSGNDNISYPIGVSTSVLYKGRKVKITSREYASTQDHTFLTDPNVILPKDKLSKFESKTNTNKPLKKSDVAQVLTKKLGMGWDGSEARKTYGKFVIRFDRGTFMKMPYWTIRAFENGRGIPGMTYTTLEENQTTVDKFIEIINKLNGMNDIEDMKTYVKQITNDLKLK
jgi:hypothetical protein